MATLGKQAVRAFDRAIGMTRLVGRRNQSVAWESLEQRQLLSTSVLVEQIGHLGGQVNAVAVSGSYAYVNQGQDLLVVNMVAPDGPEITGKVTLSDVVRDIAVEGSYVYVAEQSAGIQVVDVSSSTSPVVMGDYFSGQASEGIAAANGYVYVADHSGLKILSAADPAHLTLVGGTLTVGQTYDVAVSGNTVVMSGSKGLEVIDASNLATPTRVGGYDFTSYGFGYSVAVAGNHAYMAGGSEGLLVLDISTPSSPTREGALSDFGSEFHTDAQSVAISGQYAYVSGGTSQGVAVIDVSDSASPSLVGGVGLNSYAGDLAYSGDYVLVATQYGGLQVINAAIPSNPVPVAQYATPNAFSQSVTVVGTRAYIADGSNGLQIMDVSDAANPTLLGTLAVSGGAFYDVAVHGDYACVADHNYGMRTINISDPSHPTLVSSLKIDGYGFGVAVAGNYAYLAAREYFDIIDISNPAAPTVVGQINALGSEFAYRVTVVGSYAYVAEQASGFHIIDVSNPAAPTVVGVYSDTAVTYDVVVSGHYAYLADGWNGLQVIDVSTPSNPVKAGGYAVSLTAQSVTVIDHYAILGGQSQDLTILDISDPTSPTLARSISLTGTQYDLAVANGYVYAASWEDGLRILDGKEVNAPTALALSSNQVGEGLAVGTTVGTLSATDLDAGDTLTYTLASGTGADDNTEFTIDGAVLKTNSVFDSSGPSSYTIRVRATDSYGLYTDQTFTIGVTRANRAPTVNDFSQTVMQGTTLTIDPGDGANVFTDPDGDEMSAMRIVALPAHGTLYMNGIAVTAGQEFWGAELDGTLTYQPNAGYAGADQITWNGSDGQAFAATPAYVHITVRDSNRAPTVTSFSQTVTQDTTLNIDPGDGATVFTDPDGDRMAALKIVALPTHGKLYLGGVAVTAGQEISGADLDAPLTYQPDAGYVGTDRVTWNASDGQAFAATAAYINITVSSGNQAPNVVSFSQTVTQDTTLAIDPGDDANVFTDPDGDEMAALKIVALPTHGTLYLSGTAVTAGQIISGTDLDAPLTYQPSAGYVGSDQFTWTASDGQLFAATPAYVYITVTAANHRPTDITLSSSSVREQKAIGTVVGTLSGTDPDAGDTLTFSLPTGQANNASFRIVGNQLQTNAVFSYHTKNNYSVVVRATDQGGQSYDKSLAITVLDTPVAPTGIAISALSVRENQSGAVVGTLSASDSNAGDTFTWSLVSSTTYPDNAAFTIVGNQLLTSRALNYESKKTYTIRVQATDSASLSLAKNLTISVTNVNEAPTTVALSGKTVAENKPAGTLVGRLSATDPDAGAVITYSLTDSTATPDNAAFKIVHASTGWQLQTAKSLNFEGKKSYTIRVRAKDQGGLYREQTFPISVTNVNERPTTLAVSPLAIAENKAVGSLVGTFSATDPDAGNTFRYTLVTGTGSADNAAFSIVGSQLKTTRVFNYEARKSYAIRVRSTDQGGLFCEKAITVNVTNVNERPTAVKLTTPGSTTPKAVRNAVSGSLVGTISATDPDAGSSFTYSLISGTGSADNAKFVISGNQLLVGSSRLTYTTSQTYKIRVRVTDQGGLSYEMALIIGVRA